MKKTINKIFRYICRRFSNLNLMLNKLLSNTSTFKSVGSRSSVFSGMAWYCAYIFMAFITAGICFESVRIYAMIGALIIGIYPLIMYSIIYSKTPNLLFSEDYLIEQQKLQIIKEKGKEIEFDPVNLSTPDMKSISNSEEKK